MAMGRKDVTDRRTPGAIGGAVDASAQRDLCRPLIEERVNTRGSRP
jgi:hypothetical protein